MITYTMKDREGMSLVELLVVVLIVSIIAAIAQPQLTDVIVKARAADAVSDMQVIRVAVHNFQADRQTWPEDRNRGVVPPGLEEYLPGGFDFQKENYVLDYDNWGGSPFMVGVTLITPDADLGVQLLGMLASPKWNSADKYTWVIE